MRALQITTPVFKGPNRSPGMWVGDADGTINADSVAAVVAATSTNLTIQDIRDPHAPVKDRNRKEPTEFCVLHMIGGQSIIVVGTAAALSKQVFSGDPRQAVPSIGEDGRVG